MTKSVVAATYLFQDHGGGLWRTGPPPAQGSRPYTLTSANNPYLAAMQANLTGSTAFELQNEAKRTGGSQRSYRPWAMALEYGIDNTRTAMGQAAVDQVDALVARDEAEIVTQINTGSSLLATEPANATDAYAYVFYDKGLYVHHTVKDICFTYDMCYDLLTPTQRSRWYYFVMQVLHYVFFWQTAHLSIDGGATATYSEVMVSSGRSENNFEPFVTNNYWFHYTSAVTAAIQAFKDEAPVTLTRDSGTVQVDAAFWEAHLTTVQLPVAASQLGGMTGGGSDEGGEYGQAMNDLFFAKAIRSWAGESNIFSGIDTYLQDSVEWMIHMILPDDDLRVYRGRDAREQKHDASNGLTTNFLKMGLAAYPSAAKAPEIKKRLVDALTFTNSITPYLPKGFLSDPAIATITAATDLSNMPVAHNAAKAGDLIARSDWTASATHFHAGTGHKALGNHTNAEMGAIQIFKNAPLLCNNRINLTSNDFQDNATRDDRDRRGLNTIFSGTTSVSYPTDYTFFELSPTVYYAQDNTGGDGDYYYSWDNALWFNHTAAGNNIDIARREVCYFPNDGGIFLVFDRIETTVAADLMLQYASIYDPVLNSTEFTVNNGTSSCDVSLLSHPVNWTKINRSGDAGFTVRSGNGAWTMRAAISASTNAESVLSVVNVDGAATSVTLGSGAAGETVAIIDFADATPNKTVTFYDTQQRRSVV